MPKNEIKEQFVVLQNQYAFAFDDYGVLTAKQI